MDKKGHVLFFEPRSGGHRAEFVQYLLDYLAAEGFHNNWEYTFVLAEELCRDVRLLEESDKVQVISVGKVVSDHWKICLEYVEHFNPTHLMLMELTPFELPLCLSRPSCSISAILFVQYPELRFGGWRQRLKFSLKELKTSLFLRNPQIDRIFLLNGDASCSYLNKRFKTDQYVPLPDPVPPGEPSPDYDLREHYGLEAHIRVFLFFGSISARKGADVLLESLVQVSDETAEQSTFLLCGKPEQNYAAHYARRLAQLRGIRPELRLVSDSRFFQIPEMKAAFHQADWILMPYMRSEYSSGILAHAADAATPVIAPGSGLLGRLVKNHNLGRCSEINPRALAGAIDEACSTQHVFDDEARRLFVQRSNHFDFARIILDSLRNE